MKVPYVNLKLQHAPLKDELLKLTSDVIDHARFVMGPEVKEFEEKISAYLNVSHALGVSNGTDALVMALKAAGIKSGDEVIVPANSFITSASAVILAGGKPVFCDSGDGFNIDAEKIPSLISTNTKAMMPVHLTGRPSNMDLIDQIAKEHKLKVIEDAAQSIGAKYKERPVGSLGDIACFSLHPLKTLNALGDGGFMTFKEKADFDHASLLRNNGLENRAKCDFWSGNYRLDTLQAAYLLLKMKYLDEWTTRRRENARFYREALGDIDEITLPLEKKHEYCVYHTFIIQTDRRDALKEFLKENEIGTQIHYPMPIHLQKPAEKLGYKKGDFPVAETQAERILSLPVYPELSQDQLSFVVDIKKML